MFSFSAGGQRPWRESLPNVDARVSVCHFGLADASLRFYVFILSCFVPSHLLAACQLEGGNLFHIVLNVLVFTISDISKCGFVACDFENPGKIFWGRFARAFVAARPWCPTTFI